VRREVIFAPECADDLRKLYDDIARDAGAERAQSYTGRIIDYCLRLELFPERGTPRDDLRLGLRVTSFRRRVAIAFHITQTTVVIDRVLYGGRDIYALFRENDIGADDSDAE
jgi:toxin ParE1/3/4